MNHRDAHREMQAEGQRMMSRADEDSTRRRNERDFALSLLETAKRTRSQSDIQAIRDYITGLETGPHPTPHACADRLRLSREIKAKLPLPRASASNPPRCSDFDHDPEYTIIEYTHPTCGKQRFTLTPRQAMMIKTLHLAPSRCATSVQINTQLDRVSRTTKNRRLSHVWNATHDGPIIREHLLSNNGRNGRNWSLRIA